MIRVACQTYTWEMLGDAWRGGLTQILDAVSSAGYAGIEISNSMIREYAERPADLARELEAHGLELAAFAYARQGFTDATEWDRDLGGARQALGLLRAFPHARLGLGGAATRDPSKPRAALDQAIRFYEAVGRLGKAARVPVNVHPHSHHGSLLEKAEEYRYLMERLDPELVSLGPDTGHIARGGQDVLECLREHLPRITHLHLKDVTAAGEWAALGEGRCDIPAVLGLLRGAGYDGWVVAEEESEAARRDGVHAVRRNRAYLRGLGS